VISQCLARISEAITQDPTVILIGSSLGGFLAASTALTHSNIRQLILLNPAIIPLEQDLTMITDMPQHILQSMRDPRLFQQQIPARITILRGTRDKVVPDGWILHFATAQNAAIHFFDDDHQFSKNLYKLPNIISHFIKE